MREIQYRSVHEDFNTKEITFSYWGFADGVFKGPSSISNAPRIAEDQHTGCYDTNIIEFNQGRPIYENDIVTLDTDLYPDEDFPFTGRVVYEECCFYVDNGSDSKMLWSDSYTATVIGNIHEHPNLLDQ